MVAGRALGVVRVVISREQERPAAGNHPRVGLVYPHHAVAHAHLGGGGYVRAGGGGGARRTGRHHQGHHAAADRRQPAGARLVAISRAAIPRCWSICAWAIV